MGLNENLQQHALFSPSQPAWLNDSDEEFIKKLKNKYRSSLGTEIHDWCAGQIKLGHKQNSLREIYRDVETHIFSKYSYVDSKTMETRLGYYGSTLLHFMKYLPEETFGTIKTYVNDCVAAKMDTEVRIEFSENFFGTADAIRFDDKTLKVFDLKTGVMPAKIEQPIIYACLYLLSNRIDPKQVPVEVRIYQNNDILQATPGPEDLIPIMNKIIHFDNIMNEYAGGAK